MQLLYFTPRFNCIFLIWKVYVQVHFSSVNPQEKCIFLTSSKTPHCNKFFHFSWSSNCMFAGLTNWPTGSHFRVQFNAGGALQLCSGRFLKKLPWLFYPHLCSWPTFVQFWDFWVHALFFYLPCTPSIILCWLKPFFLNKTKVAPGDLVRSINKMRRNLFVLRRTFIIVLFGTF